ncbi:MAG: CHAT domain-containing protein [Lewinella sp.]
MTQLSSAFSESLASRLEDPLARAVRFMREEAHGKDETIFSAVASLPPPVLLTLQWCIDVIQLEQPVAESIYGKRPLTADQLKQIRRALQATAPEVDGYYYARRELQPLLDEFTADYIGITQTSDPLSSGADLVHRMERARVAYATVDQRYELAELELKVLGQQASICRRLGDYASAADWYARAASLAKECDLTEEYAAIELQRAEVIAKSGMQTAEVVRMILPIWEAMYAETAGFPFRKLSQLLAATYWVLGDTVEVKKYLEHAREDRDTTSISTSLQNWLDACDREQRSGNATLQYLFDRLMLRMSWDNLMAQLSGRNGMVIIDAVVAARAEIIAIERHQMEMDRYVLSALQVHINYEVPSVAEMDPDFLLPLADQLIERGDLLAAAGKREEAIENFESAHELARKYEYGDTALYALFRVVTSQPTGDLGSIIRQALRGIARVEQEKAYLPLPYQRAAYLSGESSFPKIHFYHLALLAAGQLKDHESFFRLAELLKAASPVTIPAGQNDRAFIDELAGVQQALSGAAGHDRGELRSRRQRLYDRYLLEQATGSSRYDTLPPDFSDRVQQSLSEGSAIITYVNLHHEHLLIGVITNHGISVHLQREKSPDHLEALKRAPLFQDRTPRSRQRNARYIPGVDPPVPASALDWETLSQWLLPPAVWELVKNQEEVIICPHRQLHRVPFHALRREDRFLVQSHTVRYVPNLSVLLEGSATVATTRIATVASTNYLLRADAPLPEIPGTIREVAQICRLFENAGKRCVSLTDDRCTRTNFLGQLNEWQIHSDNLPTILHLAVHGEDLPGEAPLDARLFLHEGAIDGFDVLVRQLPFDLVVLSSCYAGNRAVDSRELDYAPADDLFGLQASFAMAGAREMLGSLWEVDDAVGETMMITFYRYLLDGHSPAKSLALTMREYLDAAEEDRTSPIYWAPFFLTQLR